MRVQKKIKSASHFATNDKIFSMVEPLLKNEIRILDFGAGNGHMSQRIGDKIAEMGFEPGECIYPCEIVPEIFEYEKVACRKIDTDSKIPFEDNSFDVVYAIEVLEHTLRPYDLIKEAYRVLKPNGLFILSVPNLSHLNSRFSMLVSGFGTLYPPPSKKEANAGRICGHIMPLTYPYFHYGFSIAGFEAVAFSVDKRKRSCLFWSVLLWPWLKLFAAICARNLKKYDESVWKENGELVYKMNSIDVLTSRSCIVSGKKLNA